MNVQDFFESHPLFTAGEFDEYQKKNVWTKKNTLAYYCKRGRLLSVRRGLYAVVPAGVSPDQFSVDPYLIASKMADDAILSFHTALEVFGKAYSTFEKYTFFSSHQVKPHRFQSRHFEKINFPKSLIKPERKRYGVTTVERSGLDVHVTSLERTLVDLLDRPNLGGGWEEIYRSLESVEYFNLDVVIEYVHLLGKKTTAAKVGYYLQQHAEELMVNKSYLNDLRGLCPKQPHYLERGVSGILIKDWNIVVPEWLANRSWEDVI